jgi:hypothetical protein
MRWRDACFRAPRRTPAARAGLALDLAGGARRVQTTRAPAKPSPGPAGGLETILARRSPKEPEGRLRERRARWATTCAPAGRAPGGTRAARRATSPEFGVRRNRAFTARGGGLRGCSRRSVLALRSLHATRTARGHHETVRFHRRQDLRLSRQHRLRRGHGADMEEVLARSSASSRSPPRTRAARALGAHCSTSSPTSTIARGDQPQPPPRRAVARDPEQLVVEDPDDWPPGPLSPSRQAGRGRCGLDDPPARRVFKTALRTTSIIGTTPRRRRLVMTSAGAQSAMARGGAHCTIAPSRRAPARWRQEDAQSSCARAGQH